MHLEKSLVLKHNLPALEADTVLETVISVYCGNKIIANMVDPSISMHSFQKELLCGKIQLKSGVIHPELYLHGDNVIGKVRLTYVRLENKTVTAFVSFIQADPFEENPCFQIGYATPEAYRNQGRAKEAVGMAIAEIRHGFERYGAFYVEAIVGTENIPSQRIAEQYISATPVAMIDQSSGLPALQYLRKIE